MLILAVRFPVAVLMRFPQHSVVSANVAVLRRRIERQCLLWTLHHGPFDLCLQGVGRLRLQDAHLVVVTDLEDVRRRRHADTVTLTPVVVDYYSHASSPNSAPDSRLIYT